MMTTPNPTAEQIVSEALGPYGLIGRARDLAARNAVERLRAHGLLSEGAPSEAMVEAAAKAIYSVQRPGGVWDENQQPRWHRKLARAALAAAQGAAPRVDSDTQVACAVNHAGGVCPGYPHAASMQPSSAVLEAAAADAPQAPKDIHEPNHNRVYCVRCGGNWPCQPSPVLPSSGVDEGKLANLIHSTSVAHFGGLDPRVAPIIARAVAEFLKGQGRGSEM